MSFNLPNTLTISRIVMIPVFVGFSFIEGAWGLILSSFFFTVAAITDLVDGYLARKHGLTTPFGRFLDPVADKLLVISALLLLVSDGRAPLIATLILVSREIVIMALREYLAGLDASAPVSRMAKWKTVIQMFAIGMLMLQDGLFGWPAQIPGMVLLYIAVIFTLTSGYVYMAAAWPRIKSGE